MNYCKPKAWAESQLGESFDIHLFYDELLGSGSLDLTALDKQIDWVIGREIMR